MKPNSQPERIIEPDDMSKHAQQVRRRYEQWEREMAYYGRTGLTDCQALDANGKPIRRKLKSIIEVAQEHGIPLPEWFEETRPAPKK